MPNPELIQQVQDLYERTDQLYFDFWNRVLNSTHTEVEKESEVCYNDAYDNSVTTSGESLEA